ncbi:sensor histidine kinase [Streptomyces sp. NBC_00259]|uniref:sensor histidine kinase n=1 Tax=Streptomyces sp. NBC_00259 TaxID=2903643 RepID=UPI002E28A93D|nr:histidine kinase [Streptomyces sp. NBC_00259]
MDQHEKSTPPRLGYRVLTAVSRDPLTAPHRLRNDALIAAATGALAVALVPAVRDGRAPDALGWALLAGSVVPLAWRRSRPLLVLFAVIACIVPYHALDNTHAAPVPGSLLALYTVASTARPRHTFLVGTAVIGTTLTVMFGVGAHEGLEALRTTGWILAVLIFGVDVRVYRRYIASVVERAERAERTREEEAARRVAEERLRIARDLHDLLAHSITVIGVRMSVAAHILTVDPERLDRDAVAAALDEIAETCRTARGELRATLQVLRANEDGDEDEDPSHGPLPGLDALPALVRAAGAELAMPATDIGVPPATGAAVYRIVQESLTNAVRHAGPGANVTVTLAPDPAGGRLLVRVTDDGNAPGGTAGSGFGVPGMRERARSAGGTLSAGPRDGGGFEVAADLPLTAREALA